jgi:ribokinase
VIKTGKRGAFFQTPTEEGFVPAFPVRAVDSVAAGDAFNGALAVALLEGRPFPEAMRWGAAAGALAVTQPGAMSSLPLRPAVLQLLEAPGVEP